MGVPISLGLAEFLITIAGIAFCAFSLMIIFLGKKVGEQGGRLQKIEFGKFTIQMNSALTLVFIMALLATGPIILKYVYFDPASVTLNSVVKSDFISRETVEKEYIRVKDMRIHGLVTVGENNPARANVYLLQSKSSKCDTLQTVRASRQGDFDMLCNHLQSLNSDADYELVINLPDYQPERKIIDFKSLVIPTVNLGK